MHKVPAKNMNGNKALNDSQRMYRYMHRHACISIHAHCNRQITRVRRYTDMFTGNAYVRPTVDPRFKPELHRNYTVIHVCDVCSGMYLHANNRSYTHPGAWFNMPLSCRRHGQCGHMHACIHGISKCEAMLRSDLQGQVEAQSGCTNAGCATCPNANRGCQVLQRGGCYTCQLGPGRGSSMESTAKLRRDCQQHGPCQYLKSKEQFRVGEQRLCFPGDL